MRLVPVGEIGGLLIPVDHRCLVAPFRKFAHRAAVRRRRHEGAQSCFVLPRRAGPERIVGVPQQSHAKIPRSVPRLTRGSECVEDESGQEPHGPDAQACYRNEHLPGSELLQHERQNPAVAIIISLDRSVDSRDRLKRFAVSLHPHA